MLSAFLSLRPSQLHLIPLQGAAKMPRQAFASLSSIEGERAEKAEPLTFYPRTAFRRARP
jgi:hypothetical protein